MFFYSESDGGSGGAVVLPTSWSQVDEILSPEQEKGYFGEVIDISSDGNTILTSAFYSNDRIGRAHVYEKTNGIWTKLQTIDPSGQDAGGYFGRQLAISADGTQLAISAYNSAKVYIYEKQGNSYIETKILQTSYSGFGFPALNFSPNGNILTVAAESNYSVTVFEKQQNGDWTQIQHITSPGNSWIAFGWSPRIGLNEDGSTLLIGASYDDMDAQTGERKGAVYHYERQNGQYQQVQKIISDNGYYGEYFGTGFSLSNDGSTLTINSRIGKMYLFKKEGGSFIQKNEISLNAGGNNSGRNHHLSADGKTVVVDVRDLQKMRIFRIENDMLQELQELSFSNAWAPSFVATNSNGSTIVAGDRNKVVNGVSGAGSVYIFQGT